MNKEEKIFKNKKKKKENLCLLCFIGIKLKTKRGNITDDNESFFNSFLFFMIPTKL